MPPLRIVFAGTPDFAAAHLQALLQSSFLVVAAYTQPDRPAGRGKKLQASPVKLLAASCGIPVFQPRSLRDVAEQQRLRSLAPDLVVVVAYGLILPQAVLDIPRLGCINVHASLLPRWRGAAPIERALLAGDPETGITIMQMDAGLDTGAILKKTSVKIEPDDTRISLEQKLSRIGTASLVEILTDLACGPVNAEKQDDLLSSYAAKLDKSEAEIDWSKPAISIDRQIRAGIGRSPAFSTLDGLRIRILKAQPSGGQSNSPPGTIIEAPGSFLDVACADGVLRISQMQLPGRNPVGVSDLMNAHQDLFRPGNRFCRVIP